MRNLIFNWLFFLVLFLAYTGSPASAQCSSKVNIDYSGLATDLRYLANTVAEVHPRPFEHISQEDVAILGEDLLARASDSQLDCRGAYRVLAEYLAAINDSHSHVRIPWNEQGEFLESGGTLFPIRLTALDGQLQVSGYWCKREIPIGAILTSINGVLIKKWIVKFSAIRGGSSTFRLHAIDDMWSSLIWAYDDPVDQYDVEYMANGISYQTKIQGCGITEAEENSTEDFKPAAYSYKWIDDICYIDFRSMDVPKTFSDFCINLFREVEEKQARGIVIDLRRNGGGNSSLGDEILNFLTTRRYRQFGSREWTISEQYKTHLKSRGQTEHPYLDQATGTIWKTIYDLKSPTPKQTQFTGPAVFLMGPETFSSALSLVDAVKTYNLGHIIGQPSSESPNGSGETVELSLPQSQLVIQLSTAYWTRASGDKTDNSVVIPHEIVQEERAGSNDLPLQSALAWIHAYESDW